MSDEARHLHASADPDPEIPVRGLFRILLVLAAVMLLFGALMLPLARRLFLAMPEVDRAAERIDRSRPAGPLLQVDPAAELEELHRVEQRLLDSYGWVDRGAGVARVPVERALELVLAEGVGAIAAPNDAASTPAAAPATP